VTPQEPSRARGFGEDLENWRKGTKLAQATARDLRKWVAIAVARAIDWDCYLFRPQKDGRVEDWKAFIFIPNAAGNEGRDAHEAMFAICDEAALTDDVKSAQVTAILAAAYRIHEVNHGSLDYETADEDFPRYAAFVDLQTDRARHWVMARPFRAEWDPVPVLVQGLLIGARALGVPDADDDRDPVALIKALFASVPDAQGKAGESVGGAVVTRSPLDELRERLRRCRGDDLQESDSWRGLLLDLTGARQGGGQKIHALDLLRLKPAIETAKARWEFTADLPLRAAGAPNFERVKRVFSELRRLSSAVEREQQRLVGWRQDLLEWLGSSFDKDEVVLELRQTLEAVRVSGLSGELELAGISSLIDAFQGAAIVAALGAIAKLEGSPHRGDVLAVIGQRWDSIIELCIQMRERVEELIRVADHEQKVNMRAIGKDPIGDAVTALVEQLERATKLVEGLSS
jgi:hypothetical protein